MADQFDDELRRLARAARAETEHALDLELLASQLHQPRTVAATNARGGRRAFAVAGAVAAAALAVVAGVVVLRDSDTITTGEPATETTALVSVATTLAPATTPVATSEPQPTTPDTVEPTTTTTVAPAAEVPLLSVDAANPPPPVALESLATVDWDGSTFVSVAVGELGVAVSQRDTGAITVVGFDGDVRTVELTAELPDGGLGNIAYGPGDVLYGVVSMFEPPYCCEWVAIALSGERAGEIVRTGPLEVNTLELPPSPLGHGSDDIVLRARDVGATLMPYVDVAGNEISYPGVVPHFPTVSDDLVITTDSFGVVGRLSINGERAPQRAYTGPAVPAPSSAMRTVYPTFLGSTDAEAPPQPPVIAVLESDGAGAWYSIPDGYQYAASDSFGTVFTRVDGDQLDLALLADGPVNWRSLPYEFSGIRATCDGCTQLLHDRDGTPVTLDTESRMLTRYSVPPVSVTLGDEYGTPYLYVLGPDDVVYLHVDSWIDDGGDNLAADIVALSLTEGDAGREIERWVGASDYVGDSELVATRDGLVTVNCCGGSAERPAPDAEVVVPWVDRSGARTQLSGPVMRIEIGYSAEHGSLTVHRDNDLPGGTQSWTFEPGEQWQPRGMGRVIPTFDGGFIATTYHGTSIVHRGWVDGTVLSVELGEPTLFIDGLDPAGRILVANGDVFARVEPFGDRSEYWAGRRERADDGTVRLQGIDEAINGGADWSRDSVAFANAVAGRPEVNEIRTIDLEPLDDGLFSATVTTSNFFDDSGAASRLILHLRRDADGRFRFESGDSSHTCQPNRGHQDFSTDPCI